MLKQEFMVARKQGTLMGYRQVGSRCQEAGRGVAITGNLERLPVRLAVSQSAVD